MRKSHWLHFHFASSVNSLTQSHNRQEDFFYPSGLFDDWGNGTRRLLTAEKEEASTSQAADFATTVADMFIELCCLQD